MAAGISAFLANTDALGEWKPCSAAVQRIGLFDPIAVYPDAPHNEARAVAVFSNLSINGFCV
jgi:hypothetical protein